MPDTQAVSITELLKQPEVRANPYAMYADMRERGRLVPTVFGGYLVTRYADAFAILRDNRFSSNSRHQAGHDQMAQLADAVGLGDMQAMFERLMLFADPPDHTRLRRIVGKAFTPRSVEDMRPRIAAIVDGLLDSIEADGAADLVESLAFPLPVTVISEMLGVPTADHQQLRVWTAAAVTALDPSDDLMALFPAAEAMREMRTYFDALVEERRRSPGDDLLSALILAEDQGEQLTHDELLETTILLFGAGHETTVNLIAGGVLNLLTHRSELQRLREDPTMIGSAVEELLRFGPPVQYTGRIATADIDFAGEEVPKGSELIVMIAGANRDPEVFADPERLDISRADNRHLSFGGGIHLCLGAPLARVEGQEALSRLVERFPTLELATDDIEWKPTSTIRGPARLPLTW